VLRRQRFTRLFSKGSEKAKGGRNGATLTSFAPSGLFKSHLAKQERQESQDRRKTGFD